MLLHCCLEPALPLTVLLVLTLACYLQAIGSGLWPIMVLLSEIVQTFILGDFW